MEPTASSSHLLTDGSERPSQDDDVGPGKSEREREKEGSGFRVHEGFQHEITPSATDQWSVLLSPASLGSSCLQSLKILAFVSVFTCKTVCPLFLLALPSLLPTCTLSLSLPSLSCERLSDKESRIIKGDTIAVGWRRVSAKGLNEERTNSRCSALLLLSDWITVACCFTIVLLPLSSRGCWIESAADE